MLFRSTNVRLSRESELGNLCYIYCNHKGNSNTLSHPGGTFLYGSKGIGRYDGDTFILVLNVLGGHNCITIHVISVAYFGLGYQAHERFKLYFSVFIRQIAYTYWSYRLIRGYNCLYNRHHNIITHYYQVLELLFM